MKDQLSQIVNGRPVPINLAQKVQINWESLPQDALEKIAQQLVYDKAEMVSVSTPHNISGLPSSNIYTTSIDEGIISAIRFPEAEFNYNYDWCKKTAEGDIIITKSGYYLLNSYISYNAVNGHAFNILACTEKNGTINLSTRSAAYPTSNNYISDDNSSSMYYIEEGSKVYSGILRNTTTDVIIQGGSLQVLRLPEVIGLSSDMFMPIGSIMWYSADTIPNGYLICNGEAVSRETYSGLFNVIGTKYGEGDGSTTFNLPNLIGRFAEGATTAGTVKEAGLPNITGSFPSTATWGDDANPTRHNGAIASYWSTNPESALAKGEGGSCRLTDVDFDASRSSPIYGSSDTVQPPALTMLPCIKAFGSTSNNSNLDVKQLVSDYNNRLIHKAGDTMTGDLTLATNRILGADGSILPTGIVPHTSEGVGQFIIFRLGAFGGAASYTFPDGGQWLCIIFIGASSNDAHLHTVDKNYIIAGGTTLTTSSISTRTDCNYVEVIAWRIA